MKCKYCSAKYLNNSIYEDNNYHDEWSDVYIMDGKLVIKVRMIHEYKEIEVNMNYCLMCGRKIEEVEKS